MTISSSDPRDGSGAGPWPAARHAWYATILLAVANAFAFVDRQALSLLVEPIKRDLGASDTQMGLLYGFGFSLFYVTAGIPIARLADRLNRRNIAALAILFWSFATATCGLAKNFSALLLARVGVGAGEAGLTPAAMSILADYFPRDKLPRATGVYSAGVYLGGGLALIIGGRLASYLDRFGPLGLPFVGTLHTWQSIFLILGAPGLVLAAALLMVREPPRRSVVGTSTAHEKEPFRNVLAHVGSHKLVYGGLILGFSLMVLEGYSCNAWVPAFLSRKFGWTTEQIGARYGVATVICGAPGALVGGLVASWLKSFGVRRANPIAMLIGFVALIPITIAFPLMASPWWALALIGAMNFFAAFNFAGIYAALQEITPNRMRATISATHMLSINLLGAGLGPLLVATYTDRIFGSPTMLPQALALNAAIASPLAALLLGVGCLRYDAALPELPG